MYTYINTYICIPKILIITIVHLGNPPSRFVFICLAYNSWCSITRDTQNITRTRIHDFRVAAADENESLPFCICRGEYSQIDQRIFATNDGGRIRKTRNAIVALATNVGTLWDSTAASYPKFSLVGCVLH